MDKTLAANDTVARKKIVFSQDHMELFLGEWMKEHRQSKKLWTIEENRTAADAQKPKAGADCNDKYAHKVYAAFRDVVFVEKQCFNIDMEASAGDTPAEKWNQGVFKTRASFAETPNANDVLDITIDHEYTSNSDVAPVSEDRNTRTQTAQYRLIYKKDGTIAGDHAKQDYVFVKEGGNARFAPGYGYASKAPTAGNGAANPSIRLSVLKDTLGLKENGKYKDVSKNVPKQ